MGKITMLYPAKFLEFTTPGDAEAAKQACGNCEHRRGFKPDQYIHERYLGVYVIGVYCALRGNCIQELKNKRAQNTHI